VWERGQISVLECFENSVIRKSKWKYVDYCSQNFVILNFASKNFSKSKWLNLGSGFTYIGIEKIFLNSNLSSLNESPCRKTLMLKFSAHLDVSVTNSNKLIFLKGLLTYDKAPHCPILYCAHISAKMHPINLKLLL